MCDVTGFPSFESFPLLLITEAFGTVLDESVFDTQVVERLKTVSKDERRALYRKCLELREECGDQLYIDCAKPDPHLAYAVYDFMQTINAFKCFSHAADKAANE